MAYELYQSYLKNITTPMQEHIDDLQNVINDDFENASDVYTIQEELVMGSNVYTDTEVRITHVINKPSTTSNTSTILGDDFRGIIFKDITHAYGMGYRYSFDNNIWITTFSDIYHYPTASACVRRCNNTLNWYDIDENGKTKLIQEPCIIDYNLLRDRPSFDDINLLNGDARIIVQNNQATKKIINNQRFILDGQAFKIQSINSFLRQNTYDKNSVALLKIDVYKDQRAEDDDLINNIANGLNIIPNTSNIIIDPIINKICLNDTIEFSVYKNINGVNQNDTFVITTSQVPNVNYTLNIIDGNHFSITNNEQYFDNDLVITCTDNVDSSIQTFNVTLGGAW